uniref:Uncharacterized protein n=1 Tax=Rhizophora mucronata TaxID=61149 RepID=A0A2P2Q9K2_RHIMU
MTHKQWFACTHPNRHRHPLPYVKCLITHFQ